MLSLLVLLVGAAALGFAAPRRAWLAALVLGSAVALAEMVYIELVPCRPTRPRTAGGR